MDAARARRPPLLPRSPRGSRRAMVTMGGLRGGAGGRGGIRWVKMTQKIKGFEGDGIRHGRKRASTGQEVIKISLVGKREDSMST